METTALLDLCFFFGKDCLSGGIADKQVLCGASLL